MLRDSVRRNRKRERERPDDRSEVIDVCNIRAFARASGRVRSERAKASDSREADSRARESIKEKNK